MKVTLNRSYLAFCAFIAAIRAVESIRCYRCESTDIGENAFQCGELFEDSDLEPQPCDDIHDAQYCIKQIGTFEASAIECFQCSSALNISCSDMLIREGGIRPQSCDHIFEAEYCIKMTGYIHGGRIGTKRDCSSQDMGNYCNYVKRQGDKLEYRSCYFTCTGDGCNSGPRTAPLGSTLVVALIAATVPARILQLRAIPF